MTPPPEMAPLEAQNDAVPDEPWKCEALDLTDSAAIEEYERCLFETFVPILPSNPLLRDLWLWDDESRRLRTRAGYESQYIALLRHRPDRSIKMCVGVSLDVGDFWQSGYYDFELPDPPEKACEFLIFGGGRRPGVDGAYAVRKFARDFLFTGLAARGYQTAWATSADPMLWFYRRIGGVIAAQTTFEGYRRTLLRWDLSAFAPVT